MDIKDKIYVLCQRVEFGRLSSRKATDEILALFSVGNSLKEPRHVCGAQGYDPMRGDVCEACKRERGQ